MVLALVVVSAAAAAAQRAPARGALSRSRGAGSELSPQPMGAARGRRRRAPGRGSREGVGDTSLPTPSQAGVHRREDRARLLATQSRGRVPTPYSAFRFAPFQASSLPLSQASPRDTDPLRRDTLGMTGTQDPQIHT